MLDIVEVCRYARPATLEVPGPATYRPHALATVGSGNICIVLSPSHEIKVFAEGAQVFSFRNARWHLLDIQAKYEMWAEAVGNRALAERLFQTALDLADAREGALFVVLRDRRGVAAAAGGAGRPARRDARLAERGAVAGATDAHAARADGDRARSRRPRRAGAHRRRDGHGPSGRLLAVGAILLHTEPPEPHSNLGGGRRAHDRGDGGRPLRRRAEGERRRPDHLLRSAGADLGHLTQSTDVSRQSESSRQSASESTVRVDSQSRQSESTVRVDVDRRRVTVESLTGCGHGRRDLIGLLRVCSRLTTSD